MTLVTIAKASGTSHLENGNHMKPSYVKKEIVDFFYITLPERL